MDKKRYWLRGGVIAMIIQVILFILYIAVVEEQQGLAYLPLVFVGLPLSLLDEPIVRILDENSEIVGLGVVFVMNIIQWFIWGMIIGWLYGKIKNRNKAI